MHGHMNVKLIYACNTTSEIEVCTKVLNTFAVFL